MNVRTVVQMTLFRAVFSWKKCCRNCYAFYKISVLQTGMPAKIMLRAIFSWKSYWRCRFRFLSITLLQVLKVLFDNTVIHNFFLVWQGYIRGELFNPKKWTIPGLGYDTRGNNEVFFRTTNNMYSLKEVSIRLFAWSRATYRTHERNFPEGSSVPSHLPKAWEVC